jgi:hypothetical protein
MRKLFLAGILALSAGAGFGCAYGGIAVAQNGTVYVARNDMFLFGALRKLYACTPGSGGALTCTDAGGP